VAFESAVSASTLAALAVAGCGVRSGAAIGGIRFGNLGVSADGAPQRADLLRRGQLRRLWRRAGFQQINGIARCHVRVHRLVTADLRQAEQRHGIQRDDVRGPVPTAIHHTCDAALAVTELASIIPGGLTEAGGSRAADRLIDGRDPDSTTAAVVFNDQSAVGFLATLRASGIHVPRQLSVVGYDDSRLARASWARLTTIGQDTAAIARAAVQRAIARIAGEPPGKPVLIKPTLIERATTAPPTAGPPKAQPLRATCSPTSV
jgi:hypothetical protein